MNIYGYCVDVEDYLNVLDDSKWVTQVLPEQRLIDAWLEDDVLNSEDGSDIIIARVEFDTLSGNPFNLAKNIIREYYNYKKEN